jgi:hypothetical protein
MEVTMLLCDAADEVGGKLYVLGGGWTHLHAVGQPTNMALAVLLQVPWDETNRKHNIEAELLTEDGQPVNMGGLVVRAEGQIEVGRPAGIKPGSPINAPFALSFPGIALPAGGYFWALKINGDPLARAAFQVGTS